ncbi:MAG: hypothetical protein NTX35_18865 [Verrucomicrobia bacterium]|nr:hypothetical protein [Verrucomicrobiota bacterium]
MVFLLSALVVVLALTNPNEAEFRSHLQQKHGIAGTLSLPRADMAWGVAGKFFDIEEPSEEKTK